MAKSRQQDRRDRPRGLTLGTAFVQLSCWDVSEYRIHNLSASGVLLTDGPDIAPGRTVLMLLCLPDAQPLVVQARAVRTEPNPPQGIALVFTDLDVELEDRIHDTVVASLSGRDLASPSTERAVEWVPLDEDAKPPRGAAQQF